MLSPSRNKAGQGKGNKYILSRKGETVMEVNEAESSINSGFC
jgi:hypothetical protein